MPTTHRRLFDDDVPESPSSRSLVFRPTRTRPLSKEERAFNRALARVQALSQALEDDTRRTPTPDDDLQALFQQLHQTSFAHALRDRIDEARADMSAMFDELGLEVDVPDLRPDMTPDEVAAAAARFAEDLERAQERDGAHESRRPSSRPNCGN